VIVDGLVVGLKTILHLGVQNLLIAVGHVTRVAMLAHYAPQPCLQEDQKQHPSIHLT
jgi:arginine exporter protein ArgO